MLNPLRNFRLTNGIQFRLMYAGPDHDSHVEWDARSWFDEGERRGQLRGFATLLGPFSINCVAEGRAPLLLEAIEASRTRQGELSQVLGEQVRRGVELLLDHLDAAARKHGTLLDTMRRDPHTLTGLPDEQVLAALYQAAVRILMRLVVVLFAEARDLLPKSLEIYHQSYGVEGLFAALQAAEAHEKERGMEEQFGAWRRLQSLFRLVHEGSDHEALPVPTYGGNLFRRGDSASHDPVIRAIALFEDDRFELSDFNVLRLLRMLKIGKTRVRQGNTSRWVAGPVDFSDLRTEYIGIIYEGLLDYELRRAEETIAFLNIGQEPVLPLALLETMEEKPLKDLLLKLSREKSKGPSAGEETEAEGEEEEESEVVEEAGEVTEPPAEVPAEETVVSDEGLLTRSRNWALRAVEVAGWVKKPRGKKADLTTYEFLRLERAQTLVSRIVAEGKMYLVRAGGTRKGTGTFYTKPQLAVPTVRRTLEPLVYASAEDGRLVPRSPEEILAVKIVDPAMGSGSFLVAAVLYLTDALFRSLEVHRSLRQIEPHEVRTLPYGTHSKGEGPEEILPANPDDENFEERVRARLKRHVVERCIYGVDLNPMAVELARLSLWVETMDRELPFEFLDHKLKCGNSLVGCWFDRFQDYPALAWERDGGDGKEGEVTGRIKEIYRDIVKPELGDWIRERGPQRSLEFGERFRTSAQVQEANLDAFEALHVLPVHDPETREIFYTERIRDNPELMALRKAFDLWCAVWFWPVKGDPILPTPKIFQAVDTSVDRVTQFLSGQYRFFHWELEFPDVFVRETPGFDAAVGNPPWEVSKPVSKEFFSRFDPIFRMYGKQEALSLQRVLFDQDPEIQEKWLSYRAYFKALSNWAGRAADPFDVSLGRGKDKETLLGLWEEVRKSRKGFASPDHPFLYQGSADLNTYKMFLEAAHHMVREGGRLGFLVPSGVYTDKGSTTLRALFLDKCRWDWLFSFENREGIFAIHKSFKFCSLIIQKGGTTESVRTAFMRRKLADWEASDPACISVDRALIKRFSPWTGSFMEFKSRRDIEICERIYAGHPLLGEKGKGKWNVEFVREFDMTNDSRLFPPLPKWQEKGYTPDEFGRWVGPDGDIALPLYEGRMINQFDFSEKGWVSGKGRTAVWREIPWGEKTIEPQFLMGKFAYDSSDKSHSGLKVGFMDVSSATNTRTMVSTLIYDLPCGNKVPIIPLVEKDISKGFIICSLFNSFVYDFVVRNRVGGISLNFFYLEEIPLPLTIPECAQMFLVENTAALAIPHPIFAPLWLRLLAEFPDMEGTLWQALWAINWKDRLRRRAMLDAVAVELYGLDVDDFAYILRNDPDNPTGFWRVDKDLPPEQRHTKLALEAFRYLKLVGLDRFCREGWELPPEVASYARPGVSSWEPRLGWDDCREYARRLASGTVGRAESYSAGTVAATELLMVAESREEYGGKRKRRSRSSKKGSGDGQGDLFSEE